MVNIKVAVRIRPLSHRESLLGEKIIVRKENKCVLVTNPKISEKQDGDSRQKTRRFFVDFCYDSNDPKGSSQEVVYQEIGSEVLRSMFEGYNACVLAYGHSASGKTYTIMGTQENPGLTPRLCCGLFEKLDGRYLNEEIQVQIVVSFLEIYNEKVRDLLESEETVSTSGNFLLRVREHPKLGPYVQGLSEHLVTDKRTILELLTTGNKRRSTAVTENNTHSSRSHAVFTIQFKQCDGENFDTEKSSKIHMVDLAGSERASSSQSKERLKEGANINKSLVTLGNVVSALAESCESGAFLKVQSGSKSWHPFVPYRDSVLTWLLKDTLGGNSNTIMIATISPASSCLTETVNTLRYAKRTKRIVNQPIVNEDPKIRTIRQLREEIVRLKNLLLSFQSCGSCIEAEKNTSERMIRFSISETKWQDDGEKEITNEGDRQNENKRPQKGFARDEFDYIYEGKKIIKPSEDDEKRKSFEKLNSSSVNECDEGGLGQGAVLSERDACKNSCEKKSDVNGSVNDNFSHETHNFYDSLESFSPISLKNEKIYETAFTGSLSATENFNSCLMREFNFHKNSSKKNVSPMIYRSRPDLIKGISSRFRDGTQSGSSQSCTDVSNSSKSTSENSLYSSGSMDVTPLQKRPWQNQGTKNLLSPEVASERERKRSKKKEDVNEGSQLIAEKTEKRLEIIEAMTSRLYGTKKKPHRRETIINQKVDGNGDLKEFKLCKRARMKLFDLSRKLAMTKNLKKTVENDTQTDSTTSTIRVKEKSVTTDSRELEEIGISEENQKEIKPSVIMNQVFIPRSSNYVVECGNVLRIETPERVTKHESATQTVADDRICKNANTSPIKYNFRDEDCFSEDSLDFEDKSKQCEQVINGQHKKSDSDIKMTFCWPPDSEIYFSCDSEKRFTEKSKAQNFSESEKSKNKLINIWPMTIKGAINQGKNIDMLPLDAVENSSEEWKKEENLSNEKFFTSDEGTDASSSEISEDFVFCECPMDKGSLSKTQSKDNRVLYTITENNEQSDLSDAFNSALHISSSYNSMNENELQSSKGRRPAAKMQEWTKRELKKCGGLMKAKDTDIKTDSKTERQNSAEDLSSTLTSFMQMSNMNRIKSENLEMPELISFLKVEDTSKSSNRMPEFKKDSTMEKNAEKKHFYGETFVQELGDSKTESEQTARSNFQSNFQKQYLNLNISSNSSATNSAFSIDTNLFGRASQKDQNADAVFSSADSITFVFMGPAKPKISVLMEIIRRSLGRAILPSNETPVVQRMSRSRGVQCDANLIRSVSVDSAMIALSKIAKNQDSCSNLQRASSLRAMTSNETSTVSKPGGNNIEWDFKVENMETEKKKSALKYSETECTNTVEKMENVKAEEVEKTKKKVSWSEEMKQELRGELEDSDFDLSDRKAAKTDKEKSSRFPPLRQDRFLCREDRDFAGIKMCQDETVECTESADLLEAFLKEATQLLKNINFRSSKYLEFSKASEKLANKTNRTLEEKQKTPDLTTVRKKSHTFMMKDASRGLKTGTQRGDWKTGNLTWPRTRPASGKPTTRKKPTYVTFLPSRSDSINDLNDFSKCPRRTRIKLNPRSWNLSSFSLATEENESQPTSFRLSGFSESFGRDWIRNPNFRLPETSPGSNDPRLNYEYITELEKKLEESCRRLEMTLEKDQKEKICDGKKPEPERLWHERGFRPCTAETEKAKASDLVKRRKPGICAGGCTCPVSMTNPCKNLWSKGCRSTFELDSFGPGSMHCRQLCMFCREKDAELYFSTLSLNSECSPDLCRLNCYGFCPCSSTRMIHVTSSPRAYMQRLLSLRRQIVKQTE